MEPSRETLESYALLFCGYDWMSRRVGYEISASELFPLAEKVWADPEGATLEELRAALFLWQRALRFTDGGDEPPESAWEIPRRVFRLIRAKYAAGEVSPNARCEGYGGIDRVTKGGRLYDRFRDGWLSDVETGHITEPVHPTVKKAKK